MRLASFKVLELSASGSPEKYTDADQSENNHAGNQSVNHIHSNFSTKRPRKTLVREIPPISSTFPVRIRQWMCVFKDDKSLKTKKGNRIFRGFSQGPRPAKVIPAKGQRGYHPFTVAQFGLSMHRRYLTDLNSVLILAAFPITSSELTGMETAATKGVIRAIIANGTIIRL